MLKPIMNLLTEFEEQWRKSFTQTVSISRRESQQGLCFGVVSDGENGSRNTFAYIKRHKHHFKYILRSNTFRTSARLLDRVFS